MFCRWPPHQRSLALINRLNARVAEGIYATNPLPELKKPSPGLGFGKFGGLAGDHGIALGYNAWRTGIELRLNNHYPPPCRCPDIRVLVVSVGVVFTSEIAVDQVLYLAEYGYTSL